MSKRKCCYKGCQGKPQDIGVSFFRFPVNNNDRCLEWILRCGNDDLQDLTPSSLRNKRICRLHFPEDAFQNAHKKKLNHNALPLFFESTAGIDDDKVSAVVDSPQNFPKDPTSISCSSEIPKSIKTEPTDETATNTEDIKNDTTPMNRVLKNNSRLKKDVRNLKLKLLRRNQSDVTNGIRESRGAARVGRDIFPEINRRLSGIPLIFVKMQLRVGKKVSKWTKEEKELGLAMFVKSPKLYKAMLRMGFKLPSVRTVREWVNLSKIKPECRPN